MRAMDLYAVVDTKGSGRFVGIFDTRERAEQVAAISPPYYKLHVVKLNRIDPEVLDWTDNDEQRQALQDLIDERDA